MLGGKALKEKTYPEGAVGPTRLGAQPMLLERTVRHAGIA
jgi:hypothetical protein